MTQIADVIADGHVNPKLSDLFTMITKDFFSLLFMNAKENIAFAFFEGKNW
jgi:hypothetical protein